MNDKKSKHKQGLSGKDWYNQEATRAFNQAIGRVIRHKDDYGLVFLCDQRYGDKKFFDHISNWVKPYTQISPNFSQIMSQIDKFYQNCENKFSPQHPLTQNTKTHKRPGTDIVRERSELKKVLKSPVKVIHKRTNEFDVPPEQIFNLIINSQNMPISNNTSAFSSQFLEDHSTQEFINPLPMLNREDSCDSLDPQCEWCKKQQPLKNFKSPSKDGRPVCDKCWNLVDEIFD